MSRLLLISRSRKFESRLRALLDFEFETIRGATLAKGANTVLAALNREDGPEIAVLGPALSHAQTYELSTGLSALYPSTGIMVVRDPGRGTEKWISDLKVDAVASPNLDDSELVAAVERLGNARRSLEGQPIAPRPQRKRGTGKSTAAESMRAAVAEASEPPAEKTEEALEETLRETTRETPEEATSETSPATDPYTTVEPETTAEPMPAPVEDASSDATPGESDQTQSERGDSDHVDASPGITPRTIAVVSPKGGVGKTTVATNLALGLAMIAPMSVVLVDGDAQFGDVATALALNPDYTLPDAVSAAAANDAMVLKTYLTAHPGGFYAVCGARSPVDGDRVTGEQLSGLIVQLQHEFRYVVVDTAPGLGDHTLAAIERASDLVIVCGMSVTSARGLRNHLAALTAIGMLPANQHVVLNFADHDSGLSVRDVEATTGISVDVAIPRSKLIVLSTNLGVPVLGSTAKNAASKAFLALVRRFDPAAHRKQHGRHRRAMVP